MSKSTKSPRKTRKSSTAVKYAALYPNLWAFFDGAFQANSGGHVTASTLVAFTVEQLVQAEKELADISSIYGYGKPTFILTLGYMADAGYNLFGQTRQNMTDSPDDEQHRLLAFELLDKCY